MLKRCQILLEDWQLEYIKELAEAHDFSFSEMVRIVACEGMLHCLPYVYPGCKANFMDEKEFAKMITECASSETSEARRHQLTSKLYFEARKAVECAKASRIKSEKK